MFKWNVNVISVTLIEKMEISIYSGIYPLNLFLLNNMNGNVVSLIIKVFISKNSYV